MKILHTCFLLLASSLLLISNANDNEKIIRLLNDTEHSPSQMLSKIAKNWSNSQYINKHEMRLEIDQGGQFKGYFPNQLNNSDGMPIGSKGQYWIYKNIQIACSNWKNIVEKNGILLNKAYPDICKDNTNLGIAAIVLETAIANKSLSDGFWYLAKFNFKEKNILTLTDFQGTGAWYIPTEEPRSIQDKKAFTEAVYLNDLAAMKLILRGDTKIDINKMYMLSIEVGNLDTVKLILENGADLNFKSTFSNPVYQASCNDSNIDKIKYIFSLGYSYQEDNLKDMSPIYAAAQCRQRKFIDFWLDKGVDINLEKNNGQTPVFDVCRNEKNIFANKEYKDTLELLKYMVLKGADLLHHDKENVTILHKIVENGTLNQVKYVKSFFHDINLQDNFFQTPLHYAVKNIPYDQKQEKYEVVQYLVSVGANKNIKDKLGRTPYDIVRAMSFPEDRMLVLLKP